ncbi:MAG: hypothetical protein EON47_19980, partial [Acetobacteraceae bacterium]
MDHDSFGRRLRRWLKEAAPPVGLALLCGYFLWHSLEGESGLWARERRIAEIDAAQAIHPALHLLPLRLGLGQGHARGVDLGDAAFPGPEAA